MDSHAVTIQVATTIITTDIEALKHCLALKERDLRAYQDQCKHDHSAIGTCGICRLKFQIK